MSSNNYREQETRRVSYRGISLTDLEKDQKPIIEVLIPSLSPGALGGPVASGTDSGVVSFFDENGQQQQATVTTSNTVRAEWDSENNHAYPPLVKKKEQVEVYQVGNSDKFYWKPLGRDDDLRTLDRHRISISATPSTGQQKTDENTYFFELDSVDGSVTLKTSKANGEPYAYAFKIDTTNGNVILTDDKVTGDGYNKIVINSKEDIVHLSNSKGSSVHLEGENITIESKGTFNVKASKQICFDSPIYTFNSSGSSVMAVNVSNVTYNSKSVVTTAATIGLNGDTKIAGNLVSGSIRAPSFVNGPVGSLYQGSGTNPNSVSSSVVAVSADTNTSGDDNRHGAAWEQMNDAIKEAASLIEKVAAKAGASVDTSSMVSSANSAKMNSLKGA